jgi:hypothetical protein
MHGWPQSWVQVAVVSPQAALHRPSPHWQAGPQSCGHEPPLSPHWGWQVPLPQMHG